MKLLLTIVLVCLALGLVHAQDALDRTDANDLKLIGLTKNLTDAKLVTWTDCMGRGSNRRPISRYQAAITIHAAIASVTELTKKLESKELTPAESADFLNHVKVAVPGITKMKWAVAQLDREFTTLGIDVETLLSDIETVRISLPGLLARAKNDTSEASSSNLD